MNVQYERMLIFQWQLRTDPKGQVTVLPTGPKHSHPSPVPVSMA